MRGLSWLEILMDTDKTDRSNIDNIVERNCDKSLEIKIGELRVTNSPDGHKKSR
jgi:hypothetical protein